MTEGARARALHSAGQLDAAAWMYQQALTVSPDDISLRRDFAVLLMQSGREADAATLLDHPQIVDAADADLLSILALCLRATGRYPRALDIAGKANAADPRNPLCWMLLGSVMLATGTPVGAEPALRRAIALEPGFAEAWHYLGESLQAQRRWQEAIQAYRHAAAQQPTEIINIALCQAMAGRTDLALRDFETAHRLMPGRADVLAQLAHCQAMLCLHDAQLASTHELTTLLAAGNPAGVEPEPFLLSTLDIPETLKADAIRRYSGRIARPALASAPRPATQDPARGGRIRIGYLSADFGEHAIGSLVRGHFAAHDRNRFEVVGYSLTTAEALADEIIQGFDTLVDASLLDDDALAQRITDDGISVLIDMTGLTLGARPGVLARRPAHLQWGWLGFIHGQQAPWLDGLLLDAHVQPAGAAWIYDDHPIQLQGNLFPASPMQRGVRDRARFGLPEEAVVLASFNNTYKLSGDLIDSWSHVLAQADQAHLMVYVPPLARAGFLQRWQLSGGDLERLHLVDKIELEAQADRAASCDLFLDAFRYQAGATALHAIANDLPLLCLEGHQPLARLGMGLNRFLGMDELICPDIDTYVERAVQLARAPAQLSALRQRMRQQVADRQLFDARRAASAIEAAILQQLDR